MSIEYLYKTFLESSGVVTDTRKIVKNSLFFALKGETFDGNQFAYQALSNGALKAIVDDPKIASTVENTILVDDVLRTLQDLARKHRSYFSFPVLGLTGSNGKTTTKELIYQVLKTKFDAFATVGNLNNHIGVPVTILSTPLSCEFLIVEMGANHQKEIEFLCTIAQPDYVLITNIGKAHLEGFGGIEGIKLGKSEIYTYASSSNRKIFLDVDDEVLVSLLPPTVETIPYQSSLLEAVEGICETLSIKFNDITFQTHLYGDYNLPNIAVAMKVGEYFNVDQKNMIQAISQYQPDNNRSQVIKKGDNVFILDSYNANPTSMRASLHSFSKHPSLKKVVVLGDMLELGQYADTEHEEIVNLTQQLGFETCIFIGQNFKSCGQDFPNFFNSTSEASPYFANLQLHGTTILLKGSRGIAVEKLLEN